MNAFNFYFKGGSNIKQWTELTHNGPLFPPKYIPHKIPVIINNINVILPAEAEEIATFYARYLDTEYIQHKAFNKNFWKDFKKTLINIKVSQLDEIDFSLIKKHLDNEKERKKHISKEIKDEIKKNILINEEPYKFCIIDGTQQNVGNYKIEPPTIFIGRGSHPKIGCIKKRILPEDIILNLSKTAKIPDPPPGHVWGSIIHDQSVIWLASWKDNITDKNKYIFTSFESFFKAKSDEEKFNIARKLKKKVSSIRDIYEKRLISDDVKGKQLATALYLIDHLALRVGGKKDATETADTVGVTSLRVEHITLLEPFSIKLDFLGKDSIRYCKKIDVIKDVYNNLILFGKNKSKKDNLFDQINSSSVNEYLNFLMPGLTSKIYRTMNASFIFQKELDKLISNKKIELYTDKEEKLNFLISIFNQANTAVAVLCNHQKKNVSSNLDNIMNKLNISLKELLKKKNKYKELKDNDKLKKIINKIQIIKLKKELKLKMKNVSLGTSKQNYIDPRIIFAFIKRYDIPSDKIFSHQLLTRFNWATDVDINYRF